MTDTFTKMLPYFFKYEGAEIVFTAPYQFNIVVRNTIMERVKLN